MNNMRNKILMTLALLITAVGGAWAQDIATPVISGETEFFDEVTVTITCATSDVDIYYTLDGSDPRGDHPAQIDYNKAFTLTETTTVRAAAYSGDAWSAIAEVTFTKLTGPTWDAATKTGTFSMPGSDVVLTPQYAPAAQLAENGAPAAVSGLEIAADAAIITEGQSAQGTLLYAVGTSATEKPALADFSATLPNAKDLTTAGNYYVWYYIQGHDTPQGQEPSADNTFNDSEIMGPVTVELLINEHTLNIKQSPNITVTVAGTAKTPTDDKVTPVTTGQEVKIKANEGYKFRKVEVKKGGAALKTLTVTSVATKSIYYAEGDTWQQAIERPENAGSGWSVQLGIYIFNGGLTLFIEGACVRPEHTIDATKKYSLDAD